MANHKSAKTRITRNKKKSIINASRRSRVRTFVKKVIAAIAENNKTLAQETFKTAESELMKAARLGIFDANKVSRIVSRLSKKIKALA